MDNPSTVFKSDIVQKSNAWGGRFLTVSVSRPSLKVGWASLILFVSFSDSVLGGRVVNKLETVILNVSHR